MPDHKPELAMSISTPQQSQLLQERLFEPSRQRRHDNVRLTEVKTPEVSSYFMMPTELLTN